MSSGRQTGTVPKTKHNARPRRHNAVNHMSNNLEWHDPYPPVRARKESNTSVSRHSDAGDEIYEDSSWMGVGAMHRCEEDDTRSWGHVKSSNLTGVDRSGPGSNMDGFHPSLHRDENGTEERDGMGKEVKMKMERSKRKIEELQQQQAALLSLRRKAIQQVKPVQVEEGQPSPVFGLVRNRAVQQVKPVQQEEIDRANLESGLQTIQDYNHFLQALGRDEVQAAADAHMKQLKQKFEEFMKKSTPLEHLFSMVDGDNAAQEVSASLSSDDEGASGYARGQGDSEEVSRREIPKQDNREQASAAAYLQIKDLKLEEVRTKLEQLKTLLYRVERVPDALRNGETSSHCSDQPPQRKNCPTSNVLEKLHSKKFDDPAMRKAKSNPGLAQPGPFPPENWSSSFTHLTANVDYSSDEADVEYDESPVKLGSSGISIPFLHSAPKPSRVHSQENSGNPTPRSANKGPSSIVMTDGCEVRSALAEAEERERRHVSMPPRMPELNSSTNAALSLQISQLQMQIEHLQLMYQNLLDKQLGFHPPPPPPQPWIPPGSHMNYMQFMGPTSQWHQHQMLINSLHQCCQLIWHQQRELDGLRQALTMLHEEGSVYKCGGYGNNLNFDPGLLWTQTSPQMLNNQVPPGNRANNYWDNFRSYSRQNLLSGRGKRNESTLREPIPPTPRIRKENRPGNPRRGNPTLRSQLTLPNGPTPTRSAPRGLTGANLKPITPDVMSLEQNIYSELESVIDEKDRSPELLLQLLSHLKAVKSHQNDGINGDFEANLEPVGPCFSRPQAPLPFEQEPPKADLVLDEVSRMMQECEICSPEILQRISLLAMHALNLPQQHEVISTLDMALVKFEGARAAQIGEELLCVVASLLSPYIRSAEESDMIEEEGAVGGVPLPPTKRSQNVDTELAEADQPQHSSPDNHENFMADPSLPTELDNQELPPVCGHQGNFPSDFSLIRLPFQKEEPTEHVAKET